MTEYEIAEMKLKESLLQAMRRNGGAGVRVTITRWRACSVALIVANPTAFFRDVMGWPFMKYFWLLTLTYRE
jgi:hypothetical protein